MANTFGLVLIFIIMVVGATLKYRFDKKYAMPVVEESKDLSLIYKWSIVLIVSALVLYLFQLQKIAFALLFLLIPFVVYLNFKTYITAYKNRKNKP